MVFLLASTFLLYANIAAGLSLFSKMAEAKPAMARILAHLAAATCFASGFVLSILAEGEGRPGQINWLVPVTGVLGASSTILFGGRLWSAFRHQSDNSLYSWKSGMSVWAVIAGIYLVYTVVDHWMFFADPEKTGITVVVEEIHDMSCTTMTLFRMEDARAVYRCPSGMVFGYLTAQPFAPWPSYVEGRSVDLKNFIESTLANAKRIQ